MVPLPDNESKDQGTSAMVNDLLWRPPMLARIGVMRALNRHVERVFNPDRKEHHWGRRKTAFKGCLIR
jgi:hypothetical protein